MAKKSSAQVWVEYAAARAILSVFANLPRRMGMTLGMLFGSVAYHLLGKLRRVGMQNLELAFPEKEESERIQILKSAFCNLGRSVSLTS